MQTIHNLEEVYEELKKDSVQISDQYQYSHPKKTKGKVINLSLGRIFFNVLLPEDFELVNEPVQKKKLTEITNKIYEKYDSKIASDTLNNLSRELFKLSSIIPVSFKSNELIVSQHIRNKKKEQITEDINPEEFVTRLESLSKEYLEEIGDDAGINIISNAGSTGKAKPIDLGVLLLAKGPVIDIDGNISKPILNAQTDGYTPEEYYAVASEARRTLYIRGVGTQDPGALSRSVAYATANISIDPKKEDCGTKKYLEIELDPKYRNGINGRFYMSEKTNKLELIDKDTKLPTRISLRSPLYCKSKIGICKTCYGKLLDRLETKNIGLVASACINDVGIQKFAMSVRHQSSQINMKKVDFSRDLLKI